jgi:Protein of unknown function (DUF418)
VLILSPGASVAVGDHRLRTTVTSSSLKRNLGVDVARGLALISMFVAHTAPSDGPANVLYLSELLTAALFATLIGMGMWLAWSRLDRQAGRLHGRFLAGVAVRSIALIALGLLLARLPTNINIILIHLGVLMLPVAVVVRLPSSVVAAIGISFAVLGSVLKSELASLYVRLATEGHLTLAHLVDGAVAGPGSYRVTHLLAWACLGIVLARRSELTGGFLGSRLRDRQQDRTAWQIVRGDTLVAAGALGVGASMLMARSAELIPIRAYEGTVSEVIFSGLLCAAVVCGSAVLVRLIPRPVVRPIALAGAMTLTLYVAQVLVLAAFTARHPLFWNDDSWPMLIGLVIGSLAFAVLWHAVVRTGVFARGPLEGVVDLGVRAVQKGRVDRTSHRASESSAQA